MTTSHPREERGQAGEGFVLVPREPTPDMLKAAWDAYAAHEWDLGRAKRGPERDSLPIAWRALIDATPVTGTEGERSWLPMKDAPTGVPIIAKHKPNARMPLGWVGTIALGHGDEEEPGTLDTILHYNGDALIWNFHGCWEGWLPFGSAIPATAPQPAGAERVRAVLAEWFSDAEGMCRAYEGDLPDKAEIYVVAAKRSRLYLGTYGELRRAALGSGEGTAGADWHRTEAEARRDNAEIQTLREVCMLQARELKKLDPHGSTPADLDEAMNRLRGVLSASHPQSPSLSEVEAKAVLAELSDAAPPGPGADDKWCFDIEAAPKDRTPVLLTVILSGPDKIAIVGEAYYNPEAHDGSWWWAGDSDGEYADEPIGDTPIAWRHLPAPADLDDVLEAAGAGHRGCTPRSRPDLVGEAKALLEGLDPRMPPLRHVEKLRRASMWMTLPENADKLLAKADAIEAALATLRSSQAGEVRE